MIEENIRNAKKSTVWLIATAAATFLVLAVVGGFLTARHMNNTADQHAMSAGRPGDERPNALQEFQNDKAARGPTNAGANRNSAVPPASR